MSLRPFLRRIGRSLSRAAVLLTILAVLVALAIWFLGPFLGYGGLYPLGSAAVRLALLLLIALAWGIGGALMRVRRSREEQALLASLRKQQAEARAQRDRASATIETELQKFREGLKTALRFLRRGRRSPFANVNYALPWYLLLGEQGSGKSSLARAATSPMPIEGATDEGAPASFHISEEAVLVELSGGLLNPSERSSTALWFRMLDHLRSARPQQPINGVLVAVSAEDLMATSQEGAIDFAVDVRRRLDEISARLRARAPVYLVVTKLDLLLGFEEFFESLGTEDRAAVLGFPLTEPGGGAAPAEAFTEGFAAIVGRVSEGLMMRLHEEPDELRRRRIHEFPSQLALLRRSLVPLIEQVTAVNRFGEPPMVRGLFFTSAAQCGSFADVTADALAGAFAHRPAGLTPEPEMSRQRTRAFFVRGLMRDVLAPEKNLSGLTRPAQLMIQAQHVAANVALSVAGVALLALLWLAFSEARAYTARLNEHTEAARASIAEAASDGESSTSFEPVLEVLDHLRRLAAEAPRRTTLGLYGTEDAHEAAQAAYDRALENLAFPFVWRYLTDGLSDPGTSAALRFQQLKFYLMLTGEKPALPATAAVLGPDFAAKWLLYGREKEIGERVATHFAALASLDPHTPPADLRLVDHARGHISDYTLARLAYETALSLEAVQQLPFWRPVDHMGLAGPQALSRVSGASFWDGISGIYTREGFENVMLEVSGTVAASIAQDLWVLGMSDTPAERERGSRRIRDGMLDLYRVDYITQWGRLLADLDMADTSGAGEMARALALIIGQPSPVKELVVVIASETDFTDGGGSSLSAIPGAVSQLQQIDEAVLAPRRIIDVPGYISEHFREFRDAVTAEDGQQAQIDAMIAALELLYRQINHVATGGDVLELGAEPQTLLGQLTEQVRALPDALQPLFRRILNQAAAITGGSSRERLSEIWSTTVLPLCRTTTEDRYPFAQDSARDTSLEDFATLFGPTGALATFRNDYLKPYIDSTTRPWRWRTGQQLGLGFGEDVLLQFEVADEITTAYFGASDQPGIRFTVEPIRLDPRARAFQFELGGSTLVYTHGPPEATALEWPAQPLAANAIMSMTPEIDGERSILRREGPWALFRLFDAGSILDQESVGVLPYQFDVGSRRVWLQVTTPPSSNPFSRDLLTAFRCPEL